MARRLRAWFLVFLIVSLVFIPAFEFGLVSLAYASTVETLRPNADTASKSLLIYPASPTTHFVKVNETTGDNDTTYVNSNYLGTAGLDLYDIVDTAIPAGSTINSVTVYAWCRSTYSLKARFRIALNKTAPQYSGYKEPTTTYTLYSQAFTGVALSDLNALQIGIEITSAYDIDTEVYLPGRCTQVYVEIDYTTTNTAPTNDACDSTATFTVNIDGWVNMTVSDANLVADLATVMISVTTFDSKTFNLTWTQATDAFAETLDASGICTLNSTSSVRVNVDSDTDKIAFLFKISVAAQSGACSVQATTTDDGALSDTDTYSAEFSIASYSVLTILSGNSTHTWVNATSGTSDNLLDQGAIYFNVTANFVFKIQAKGDGNLIKGSDYIALGNVTIHADTLGSSIPLTTEYADVGGLTSQAMGADLTLSVKVWLDVPADQPVGNYLYVLTLQVTS
jgi:hypothetical protein